MKPFLKYPGGKTRELKYIIPEIPKQTNRYFEPFLGGGAVYFEFDKAKKYLINDKSEELIFLYEAIKNQDKTFLSNLTKINDEWKNLVNGDFQDEFYQNYLSKMMKRKQNFIDKQENLSTEDKEKIYLTAKKSAYYAMIREKYNQNRQNKKFKENAANFYFIREFCYSSMFRFSKNGNFNVPYGGMSYNNKNFDEKLKIIKSDELLEKLSNTEIFNLDFEAFLKQYELNEQDFIFLDPPYDTEFSTYDENDFGQNEQIRLSNLMKNTKAKWMLVIKDTDFIRSLYPENDKNIFYNTFDKKYSVSFMNRNNRKTNHLMITNYEVKKWKN